MPTFTSYPALQARGIDMPAIRDRAQQRQGQRTSNALRQAQLQEMQGAQGRRNQYNALVPQIIAGDQAAIGQGMMANPAKTAQIVDFYVKADKRKQDEFKQGLETQVNLMKVVQSAPLGRRAQMWGVALERAQAEGLNIKGAPTAYDDQWTSEQIALGEAVLGQIAKAPKPPTGYQSVEGGLERIPGGPADPAQVQALAEAGRAPELQYGDKPLFDEQIGKFYQLNPKTRRREYITPKSGMSLTVGEDGTVTFTQGAAGMEKKTRGNIEKSLVGAKEGLARLRDIQSKYKPEFQEIPTRIGVAWTGLKARFGAGDVSSDDRSALTEFADYRRTALSNINLYIKEITGAQMSIQEADRLRKALPDPGEGIFGGDDPITFKANMDSVMADLEKSVVRFNHYLTKGITDSEEIARLSPLGGMRIIKNDETGERFVEVDQQWVPM